MFGVCARCGEKFPNRRAELGYKTCMPCGEIKAKEVKQCIVPMHKSNYVPVTNKADLLGINNKGGLVK